MARIELLRAAEAVFAEKGLAATKVEEITRRAGLSKGAFYLHFDSKAEAFTRVVESFLARINDIYRPPSAFSQLPETAVGMVQFWVERDVELFEFLWQNRPIVSILGGCQGQWQYLFEAFHAGVRETCLKWIDEAKKRGFLRPELDDQLAATIICGGYDELSHQMLVLRRKPDVRAWIERTLDILLRGIGTGDVCAAIDRVAKRDPRVTERIETHVRRPTRAVRSRARA
jgi:AcrR family transcriptional regulator